jgi:hypothetical protein
MDGWLMTDWELTIRHGNMFDRCWLMVDMGGCFPTLFIDVFWGLS